MKCFAMCLLLIVAFAFMSSSAFTAIYFQDDFSVSNPTPPKWLVTAGTFTYETGQYVAEDGTGRSVILDPLRDVNTQPNQLLSVTDFEMSYSVNRVNNSGVMFRYLDADNYYVLYYTNRTLYYLQYSAGYFGLPMSEVGIPTELDENNALMFLKVQGDVATATISDGTYAYSSVLNILGSATAGGVGLYHESVGRPAHDNVIITDIGDQAGSVTGVITDATTSSGIEGVTVGVQGYPQTDTTDATGAYTITGISPGLSTVVAYKMGYARALAPTIVPSPGSSGVTNITLTSLPGLDWARCARPTSSARVDAAQNINDGNTENYWDNDAGIIASDWVQLEWDQAWDISTILINSSGPIPDYTIETSTDGTIWTMQQNFPATSSGNTYWIDLIEPATPISAKYLRLVVNATSGSHLYSIECYKAKSGTVQGYVRDGGGTGIANADVIVTESVNGARGPSAIPLRGTTNSVGYYSIPVPAGKVIVTAAAADSFTVTSATQTVTDGNTVTVPDLVVTNTGTASVFSDNFDDILDGNPDPRWVNRNGAWYVQGGKYYGDATTVLEISNVMGSLFKDGIVDVDVVGRETGIVTRYTDANNYLLFVRGWTGNVYWHEHYNGAWPVLGAQVGAMVSDTAHMRVVVNADKAQGFIWDDKNTFWTEVVTIQNLMGVGPLGSGEVGLFYSQKELKVGPNRYFDNFSATTGTSTIQEGGPGDAKAGGEGWTGIVRGICVAKFTDYSQFVIEEQDRSSALLVTPMSGTFSVGDEVLAYGTMQADGTFLMAGTAAATGTTVNLGPLGMTNKSLKKTETDPGTRNKDLLVSTWGKILDTPETLVDGSKRFHITDGSAAATPTVEVPAGASGTIIYSENFDAYPGNSPLTIAGWGDGDLILLADGTAGLMSGRWADGASAKGFTNQQFPNYMTGLLNTGVVTLTARVYWRGYYCEFGAKAPSLGVWNEFESRTDGNIYFYSEWAYAAGILMPGFSINDDNGAIAEIILDYNAHRMRGALTDPIGNHSATTGWLPFHENNNNYYAIDQLYIRNYVGGSQYGIRVDDIVLRHNTGSTSSYFVPADSVQVIVPPSVTLPALAQNNYVKVVGVAGNGETLSGGAIRGVTVRSQTDITKY